MTEGILELEVSSTAQAGSEYAEWVSTSGELSRSATLCEFALAVSAQLKRVAALEANWDAQGAHPVKSAIVEAARELLSSLPREMKNNGTPIPAVVPMRKGNLQFEWHAGPRTLELEIETPSTIHYLKFDSHAGIEEEDICAITDTDTLAGLILWFVGG